MENAVLFPNVAERIGTLDGFTGMVSGMLPVLGQKIASTQLDVRLATSQGMYDIGLLDRAGLTQVQTSLRGEQAGLVNDFATSLIFAGNPLGKVAGGVLLSTDASAGKATAVGSMERMLVNTVRSLSRSAATADLAVATTLGRYASMGGAIDAIKASGVAAETFADVAAVSRGYRTFAVQRANGTGFDKIAARIDADGTVREVLSLDVKNTTGTVNNVTAFGAGAKRPTTYQRNLDFAINQLASSSDPVAIRVAQQMRAGNFDLAVVTHPNATLPASVSSAVQSTTGKIPSVLGWLP